MEKETEHDRGPSPIGEQQCAHRELYGRHSERGGNPKRGELEERSQRARERSGVRLGKECVARQPVRLQLGDAGPEVDRRENDADEAHARSNLPVHLAIWHEGHGARRGRERDDERTEEEDVERVDEREAILRDDEIPAARRDDASDPGPDPAGEEERRDGPQHAEGRHEPRRQRGASERERPSDNRPAEQRERLGAERDAHGRQERRGTRKKDHPERHARVAECPRFTRRRHGSHPRAMRVVRAGSPSFARSSSTSSIDFTPRSTVHA